MIWVGAEHGYCEMFEEKVANVRPGSSLMREAASKGLTAELQAGRRQKHP